MRQSGRRDNAGIAKSHGACLSTPGAATMARAARASLAESSLPRARLLKRLRYDRLILDQRVREGRDVHLVDHALIADKSDGLRQHGRFFVV